MSGDHDETGGIRTSLDDKPLKLITDDDNKDPEEITKVDLAFREEEEDVNELSSL